jgi:hypothetical protein
MYHPPGISSAPTVGDRLIEVPAGSGRVIVAAHNYRIEVEPESGETIIYSTDSDGSAVEAKIHLKGDGTIELNGDSESLTMYGPLNTALGIAITAIDTQLKALGQAGVTLDISAAEAATLRTDG